jgi:hypothetical protein
MARAAGCLLATAFSLWVPAPSGAQGGPPCAACIVVVIEPSQEQILPPVLHDIDVLVRVESGGETAAAPALRAIAERAGHPGLLVGGPSQPSVSADLLAVVTTLIIDVRGMSMAPDVLAYEVKRRLTALRAASPGSARLGVFAPRSVASSLQDRGVDAYFDFFVREGEFHNAGRDRWADGGVLTDIGAALTASRRGGVERWLWRLPQDAALARHVFEDLTRAAPLLPAGLIEASGVEVRCGARRAPAYLNPSSLDNVAWADDCAQEAPVIVTPSSSVIERVRLSSGDTLVRFVSASQERYSEDVAVAARRRPTAEEIVARHQAAAARQNAAVKSLISSGTLTITFEAPGFPAPVTVTSDAIIYADRQRSEIEQRGIRVNGVEFTGRGTVPRLPIIEPERVASPPLSIALTNVYRFRLDGEESFAGTRCYVIAFEPVAHGQTLFRGRAWIAVEDFGVARLAAAQTGLRGPIVASEQIDEFRRSAGGFWLLARSEVRQTYQGAAHRTPVHRFLMIERQDVNPSDFEARRAAAHASDSLILRDTPKGYRYVHRGAGLRAEDSDQELERTGRATRVRTFAFGVLIDPNITRPLPFAGLSYVDFDLFGTGAQLSGFFGGTYAQAAFSVPSVGGTRWQIAGRTFGIASTYNDRAFAGGREQYDQNVRQRPAHASVWLLRPVSARVSLRAGYELDYTHFSRSDLTGEHFEVPADQLVHGLRVALEGQRAGWNGSVWWNPAVRTGWRPWGAAGSSEYNPRQRTLQKYGATVERAMVLTPQLVARTEVVWMAGRDLDRFSRYSFGTFENRLHGYPSALIRYDHGGVVRGTLAWAAGRLVRVDSFVDVAFVRDPGFSARLKNFTGIGAALEAPAPFGMLLAAEWGFGIQGLDDAGGRGTHVVRVTGYKVF